MRRLELLSVSQFTLYAKTAKGNKPDFHLAMPGDGSQAMYNELLSKLQAGFGARPEAVKDGWFLHGQATPFLGGARSTSAKCPCTPCCVWASKLAT